MTPRRFRRLCDIIDRRQPDLTVLMDNVHKPHNVSAVVRTCDAVGVFETHAVAPEAVFRADPGSAGGSGKWVPVRTHADHEKAFAALHDQGLRVLAAHWTNDAVDFRSIDYTLPTAILLGSELDGVGADAASRADGAITVPMAGAVASLNVSVAAAIILYEAQRQRAAAGMYETPRIASDVRHQWLFERAYPKLADLHRRKGLPYPRLDDEGTILDPVPRG